MKLLYIAPYRSDTSWGEAARHYLKSLMTVEDLDIVIKPIYMDNTKIEHIDLEFQELEQKTNKNYDAVIMKCLPFLPYYDGRCGQNILLTVTESMDFEYSGWKSKLNIMDKVLCPDTVGKRYLSKITQTPVYNVGEAIDVETIENNTEVFKLSSVSVNSFKFYAISELSDRKNINKLIQAYLAEFSKLDDVILVLKINKPGIHPQQMMQSALDNINILKNQKLRRFIKADLYPPIQLIGDYLPNINSLHRACDCLIVPSKGESFNLVAAEAMVSGNPVIVTSGIGSCDFITDDNGYIVKSTKESCLCKDAPLKDYYTSNESWFELELTDLRKQMRSAYENKKEYSRKRENAQKIRELVNYRAVGQRIWNILDE